LQARGRPMIWSSSRLQVDGVESGAVGSHTLAR